MQYLTIMFPKASGIQAEGIVHLGDDPGESSVLWLYCHPEREQRIFVDESLAESLRSFIRDCAGSAGD
jgi:hypothetical protein